MNMLMTQSPTVDSSMSQVLPRWHQDSPNMTQDSPKVDPSVPSISLKRPLKSINSYNLVGRLPPVAADPDHFSCMSDLPDLRVGSTGVERERFVHLNDQCEFDVRSHSCFVDLHSRSTWVERDHVFVYFYEVCAFHV